WGHRTWKLAKVSSVKLVKKSKVHESRKVSGKKPVGQATQVNNSNMTGGDGASPSSEPVNTVEPPPRFPQMKEAVHWCTPYGPHCPAPVLYRIQCWHQIMV
ncbi:MAG: hypothetical protein ABW185_17425, partial [Sedimenticola sp.]